jgi:site-specific DNA-adenine methylase
MLYGKKNFQFVKTIIEFFDNDLKSSSTYVEPFGGTFTVGNILHTKYRALTYVYNDTQVYDFESQIKANVIHHMDYKQLIAQYDSPDTFFNLDPPYLGKEQFYGLKSNDYPLHTEIKKTFKNIQGKACMTYNNHEFIRGLYDDYKIIDLQGVNKGQILIIN